MADKALLTGINDYQKIGDLRGCLNDTASMYELLTDHFGFEKQSVRVLKDANVNKTELQKQWRWLLGGTKSGDRIVFHFSGHGSYTTDRDGDEDDGVDELLCLHGMDWDHPDTYLLDDELRAWTSEVPDGVRLTMILDCCHSGTGTRMVAPPRTRGLKADAIQAVSLVDVEASFSRLSKPTGAGTRGARAPRDAAAMATLTEVIVPESADKIGPESVLSRFAPPPPEVIERKNRAGLRGGFRRLNRDRSGTPDAAKAMNHVLWTGCQSDQTSADAYIGGDYHGAFTYYFCNVLRSQGTEPQAETVVQSLRQMLSEEGFRQNPQLEPEETSGPVFQRARGANENDDHEGSVPSSPPAEIWTQILATLQQIAGHLSQPSRGNLVAARTSRRGLVYVHGICFHRAGYSDPWWQSMSKHLGLELRAELDGNRPEVLWSKHVSATDRAATLVSPADVREQQLLEQRIRDVLQDRATQEVALAVAQSAATEAAGMAQGSRAIQPSGPVPRAAFGVPGLECVDDFAKYLVSDSVRTAVIGEFHKVVRPMLARGETIDVISHSWGTVVAYEALRQLDDGGLPGRISNFFTVGSALSISLITNQLRPVDGRKPGLVDRWINIDATADFVGGSLQAVGLSVDQEYLSLEPVGCEPFGWPLKLYSPTCAHSSYFHPDNTAVNRDIFAAAIQS